MIYLNPFAKQTLGPFSQFPAAQLNNFAQPNSILLITNKLGPNFLLFQLQKDIHYTLQQAAYNNSKTYIRPDPLLFFFLLAGNRERQPSIPYPALRPSRLVLILSYSNRVVSRSQHLTRPCSPNRRPPLSMKLVLFKLSTLSSKDFLISNFKSLSLSMRFPPPFFFLILVILLFIEPSSYLFGQTKKLEKLMLETMEKNQTNKCY